MVNNSGGFLNSYRSRRPRSWAGEATPGATTPTDPTTPTTPTAPNALQALLQDFTNAMSAYMVNPQGSKGVGGFGAGMADWLRSNQDYLQQRFLEEYMRKQLAGGGSLQDFTPENFLANYNPFVQYFMTNPNYRGGVGRMPATGVRRLKV